MFCYETNKINSKPIVLRFGASFPRVYQEFSERFPSVSQESIRFGDFCESYESWIIVINALANSDRIMLTV